MEDQYLMSFLDNGEAIFFSFFILSLHFTAMIFNNASIYWLVI